MGATALGVAATFVFWFIFRSRAGWAVAAGIVLGLAQFTKFSMLLLYAVWPFLWLVRHCAGGTPDRDGCARASAGLVHGRG